MPTRIDKITAPRTSTQDSQWEDADALAAAHSAALALDETLHAAGLRLAEDELYTLARVALVAALRSGYLTTRTGLDDSVTVAEMSAVVKLTFDPIATVGGARREKRSVCPQCYETAVPRRPTTPHGWAHTLVGALGVTLPDWSHTDGTPLCPVMTPGGYKPSPPAAA